MVVGAIHLHHHANGLAFSKKSSTHRFLQQSSAPIESLWNGASNNLPPAPGAFFFLISRYLGLRTAFRRRDAPSPASGRWPAIPGLGHISLPPAGSRPRPIICRASGARGVSPTRPRMSSRVSEANRGIYRMPKLRKLISPQACPERGRWPSRMDPSTRCLRHLLRDDIEEGRFPRHERWDSPARQKRNRARAGYFPLLQKCRSKHELVRAAHSHLF